MIDVLLSIYEKMIDFWKEIPCKKESSLPAWSPNNFHVARERWWDSRRDISRNQVMVVCSSSILSSRDPISIPVMATNFKPFVSVTGPVFGLQDRIEEAMLWKRGWLRTTVWMVCLSLFVSNLIYP